MTKFNTYVAKNFPKGTVILRDGDTPDNLFLLKNGFVKQYVTSKEGKELVIHIYEKGAIFPLMWGLNNETPNYSLETLANSEIVLISKEEFINEIQDDSAFLFDLTKRLLHGLSGLSKRIEILNTEDANIRIKETLWYLQRHFGKKLEFTHEDIAHFTGLSRERVSLEMKKLALEGSINYKRGKIRIN